MKKVIKLWVTSGMVVAFAAMTNISAFAQDTKPAPEPSTPVEGVGGTTSCGNDFFFPGSDGRVEVFQEGDKKVTEVYVNGVLVLREACGPEDWGTPNPEPEPEPNPVPDPKK